MNCSPTPWARAMKKIMIPHSSMDSMKWRDLIVCQVCPFNIILSFGKPVTSYSLSL